jgi:drug/metabolite transporter (DMT)-like permease
MAAAQLFAAMALVGTYVALVKPLTALFPLFALAFLRFAIAALALLPWTWRPASEPALTGPEARALFLQSFFGNFLFSICMLSGVSMMPAAAAGVVMSTLPVVVALFSRAMLGEQLSRRLLLAVASAAGGIWLLQSGASPAAGGGRWLGAILVMAAVCCEALYVVIGKRLVASRSPMRITAWINLWGLALTAPLGLWQLRGFELESIGAATWAVLGFYSIGSSVVAVWLWMSGLRRVPASHAGIFTVALPLAATAVAVAWLGEPAGGRHALALALALVAIWLTVSRRVGGMR